MSDPKTAEVKVVPVEPKDAPRTHVPEMERAAFNPMPKSQDWSDLRLFRYDGTDLYQWFGKRGHSGFEDTGCDPFVMRPAWEDRAPPAPSGWRTMESAPRDGTRMALAFDDVPDLPYHWEIGRFRSGTGRGSGWCNTYGHPFSGEPTHWWIPHAPASTPAEKGEGEDLAGKLTTIRDKFLIPTPDKDFTDYAIITRCIEALSAQPVSPSEGEAVAWRWPQFGGGHFIVGPGQPKPYSAEPLYTHPASDQSDTERMRALREGWAAEMFDAGHTVSQRSWTDADMTEKERENYRNAVDRKLAKARAALGEA